MFINEIRQTALAHEHASKNISSRWLRSENILRKGEKICVKQLVALLNYVNKKTLIKLYGGEERKF